jgi:hypothetical protein
MTTSIQDDGRLVVSPQRAKTMLDCGLTRLYQLMNSGELISYRDHGSRRITVQSIRDYVAQQLAAQQLGAVPCDDPAKTTPASRRAAARRAAAAAPNPQPEPLPAPRRRGRPRKIRTAPATVTPIRRGRRPSDPSDLSPAA